MPCNECEIQHEPPRSIAKERRMLGLETYEHEHKTRILLSLLMVTPLRIEALATKSYMARLKT